MFCLKKRGSSKYKLNLRKFVIFIAVLLISFYVIYTLVSQQIKLKQRQDITTQYKEKINDAKLENEQLNKELENSKSDEYLEKMAREKLGLVKANDRVFVDVTKEK